jgi:hypothetical protein
MNTVGASDGARLGRYVGESVGLVGTTVGTAEGFRWNHLVGVAVGRLVG